MLRKDAAVFILLGQSNATGHATPMAEEDKITTPLRNVFGLHRDENQSFDIDRLTWSGYLSGGMNLGETQDHTYSLANCLARQWQDAVDGGKDLPDLYIIQIAIGAQGVTQRFMWYPQRERQLIPGKLGVAKISLYSFTRHILSLVDDSFRRLGKTYEIMGIHWRGGEEEDTVPVENMNGGVLRGIYDVLFPGFCEALGKTVPIIIHKVVDYDACLTKYNDGGAHYERTLYVDSVFQDLVRENEHISMFDARTAPHYDEELLGKNLFIKDLVHYTPQTNAWVAETILREYEKSL